MAFVGGNPQGQPQTYGSYVSQPRDIWYTNPEKAQYVSPPIVIDGTLTWNAENAPYTWCIFAGTLFGRVTATGKYTNSILGLTTVAYASGGLSLTTDANIATYLQARNGSSGTFNLTGPPSASTTAAAQVTTLVTYSAINTATGVITVSNIGQNYVAGSAIQPNDGSQTIKYLMCDNQNIADIDAFFNRIDVQCSRMAYGGGTVNTGYIVSYPTDVGLQQYIKVALRAAGTGYAFLDDIAP